MSTVIERGVAPAAERRAVRPRRGEPFIRALVQPSWSAYYDHVDEGPGAAESSA